MAEKLVSDGRHYKLLRSSSMGGKLPDICVCGHSWPCPKVPEVPDA